MTGFYQFRQINSGGSTIVDSKLGIGEYIFLWATSWENANQKAREIGLFGLPYCKCCGERFYSLWKYDEPMKNGEEDTFSSLEKEINIFFHLSTGLIKQLSIPNTHGKSVHFIWNEEEVRRLTAE